MKEGYFYFISDDFYRKFDAEHLLMANKEGEHLRPCFYAFPDKQEPSILWCIPISSQVDKFNQIVQNKLKHQRKKGVLRPRCNTIRFGSVLGCPRAFLIQNMFPITKKYILNTYLDRNTQNPVTISPKTEKDIQVNARFILNKVNQGYTKLVFPNILEMKRLLLIEQLQEHEQKIEPFSFSKDKATWQF